MVGDIPMPGVRVATFNMLFVDEALPARIKEAAEHLKDCDVVLLQEAALYAEGSAAHELAALLGMEVAAMGKTKQRAGRMGVTHHGTAILSKLPIISAETVAIDVGSVESMPVAWLQTRNNRVMLVSTAHWNWGGHLESVRLEQAHTIDTYLTAQVAKFMEGRDESELPITVLGGDFNTLEDCDSIRYLRGKGVVDGTSTFWVDAWADFHTEPGYTNVPVENPWGQMIARAAGIHNPERVPPRRIDYLMVKGWVYGRPGEPLQVELRGRDSVLGYGLPSDHYMVVAFLADPPRINE